MDDKLLFKHWLSEIEGIGWVKVNALLEQFKTPEKIYNASKAELEETYGIGRVCAELLLKSKDFKEKITKWESWEEKGIDYVFADEKEYPKSFAFQSDMPYRIFYKGKLPDIRLPAISVVGARGCTSYGKAVSLKISETFAKEGWQIISGMAAGIDAFAHEGALKAKGYTCAVLGCGVDICYPVTNFEIYEDIKRSGCIISEFEPGQKPKREFFPFRNRLIAALSDAVVVVEARKRSGSLITADIALEQGKEVYVVPGRITDPLSMGCIGLLNEGANALTDLNDLRECHSVKGKILNINTDDIGKCGAREDENLLDTNYLLLYSCLDLSPKSLEYLMNKTSIPGDEAFLLITRLKLEGKIEEVAHNMFVRTSV